VGAGARAVLTTWEEKPDTIAENRAVPNVMSSRIQIAVCARTQITTPTKLARGDSACPMSGLTRAGVLIVNIHDFIHGRGARSAGDE
jgi:hypothetical protein